MEGRTLGYLFHVWVVVAVGTGMGLVVFGSTLLATAGAVLIIVGLVSLMPAFKYYWWDDESTDENDVSGESHA